MTLDELLVVCVEQEVSDADLLYVLLDYRDGEDPLETIARATRRCALCTKLLGDEYVETNGLTWCPSLPECKDRARGRLHVPWEERKELLWADQWA